MSTPIVVAISAGRYDKKRPQIRKRINRARKKGADIIIWTEVMPNQRDAFRGIFGWDVVFIGEYAFLWKKERFRRKGKARNRLRWLSRTLFRRGTAETRADSGRVRLKDLAGGPTVDIDLAHLPAHLDAGRAYTEAAEDRSRVAAHSQALRSTGENARLAVWRRPKRARIWAADVNVNLFKPEWRDFVDEELEPLRPVWTDSRLPMHGDLPGRLVVGAWVHGLRIVSAKILTADSGSDHKMMMLTVQGL